MSQADSKSSGPTREQMLEVMKTDVWAMLQEKVTHYGHAGGFYETNGDGDYSHAIGEVKLKLSEFSRVSDPVLRRRLLVKALAWTYLIYETEYSGGPK